MEVLNPWSAGIQFPPFVFRESSRGEQVQHPSESQARDRRLGHFSTLCFPLSTLSRSAAEKSQNAPQRHFLRLYLYYLLRLQWLSIDIF